MKFTLLPACSRSFAVFTSCALLGASAMAQAPAAPGATTTAPGAGAPAATPKPKPLSAGEQSYVRNTLKSLYYQVQLANAAKGLTDQGLSRLRDTTAKDLGGALDALTKIATAQGEKAPTEISGTDKVDLDRVTKAKPDKLAKEWVTALAKEAKHLAHETEATEKTAQDPDLKTFISNYAPSIRNVAASSEQAEKAANKPPGKK